jgi:hypothetical protein
VNHDRIGKGIQLLGPDPRTKKLASEGGQRRPCPVPTLPFLVNDVGTPRFAHSTSRPSPQPRWSRCSRSSSIEAKRIMPSGISASIEPSEYSE